ncbi:hypothetical protein [Psychromonas algicola]|uniref:hypothetical protein n=1 Tax=Psychromonas algicola TaxID=2555642 RepID=UPI001ABAD2B1|nr:hypothetical protein [Psychromonas sp. RZ5]
MSKESVQDKEQNSKVQEYQDTAYNSQNIVLQESRPPKSFLRKMATNGRRFGFSQANDCLSLYAISNITPKDALIPENDDRPAAWSHESWLQEDFTAWGQVYALVVSLARFSLIFLLPLFYSFGLLGFFF